MSIVVIGLLALMGLTATWNGASVLLQGCGSVTFDGSQSVGGRGFLLNASCLASDSTADSIPTPIAGFGLIIVGLAGLTAYFWLPRVLNIFQRDRPSKASAHEPSGLPRSQLTKPYCEEIERLKRIYEPQLAERLGKDHVGPLLNDAQVATLHGNAFRMAGKQLTDGFKGRNAHRQRSEFNLRVCTPEAEWIHMAWAAKLTNRSHEQVWEAFTKDAENQKTPLGSLLRQELISVNQPPGEFLI